MTATKSCFLKFRKFCVYITWSKIIVVFISDSLEMSNWKALSLLAVKMKLTQNLYECKYFQVKLNLHLKTDVS